MNLFHKILTDALVWVSGEEPVLIAYGGLILFILFLTTLMIVAGLGLFIASLVNVKQQ
jgi:hypothetical protein